VDIHLFKIKVDSHQYIYFFLIYPNNNNNNNNKPFIPELSILKRLFDIHFGIILGAPVLPESNTSRLNENILYVSTYLCTDNPFSALFTVRDSLQYDPPDVLVYTYLSVHQSSPRKCVPLTYIWQGFFNWIWLQGSWIRSDVMFLTSLKKSGITSVEIAVSEDKTTGLG
jgi:hypothetical protein